MATKKQRRVKHLNEVGASVQFRANELRVSVTVPWEDLERRLGVSLQGARKKLRKKTETDQIVFCRIATFPARPAAAVCLPFGCKLANQPLTPWFAKYIYAISH